jgi:hypothetical protein
MISGVTPPFVKNCTLSREAEVTTAPELLKRGLRGSLDRIEDLSSVSPIDPDITPIPLVNSGLSVQFSTKGGVTPSLIRPRLRGSARASNLASAPTARALRSC